MGSIYKRTFKSGTRYYLNYRDEHGKRVRESLGYITRKEAESILRNKLGDVEKRKHGLAAPPRREKILFEDFAREHFLRDYEENNKASSYRTCKLVFEAHVIPFFGGIYLDEIAPESIEEYKQQRSRAISKNTARRKDGVRETVSRSTINKELRLIKFLFSYAWKRDYIATNPARLTRQFRVPEKEPRFLSTEEIEKFQAACENISAMKRMVFLTALHTGMRLSELYNLRWEDLDFENRRVKVVSRENWDTKNYRNRYIPMTEVLYLELMQHRLRYGSLGPYCFCHGNGEQFSDLGGTLSRVAREAGLKHFTMHTLRHTFASHLVMNGEQLPTVQKLLGHSTITTTMIYAHLSKSYLQNSVSALGYGKKDVTQRSRKGENEEKEAASRE